MDTVSHNRITFLITGLDIGGAEVLLREKVLRLRNKGYVVKVISLTDIGPIGAYMQSMGVDVQALGGTGAFDIRIVYRCWRAVRIGKPDILHSHLFHANLLGRIIGRLCGVSVIISTIHNIDFGGALRERLLRWTDSLATCTVAISHKVGEVMLEKRVVPKHKLHIIDNGVDIKEFTPVGSSERKQSLRKQLELPRNCHIFISVGRLQEQKGYLYLLETATKLLESRNDFLFIVLGEGELRTELEKSIQTGDLTDYVQLLGNRSNVLEYLHASDTFFMPSLWEGLPIALLEAMACSLPAIATSVGGVSEALEEGVSGYLAPAHDTRALTGACIAIIDAEESERKRIGAHARDMIVQKFSLGATVKGYIEVYKGLM